MERGIAERFGDAVLREAMDRYGIAPDEIRPLAASESFVYAFGRGPDRFVLRFCHDRCRSEAMIEAEVEWIDHLAEGGVPVARAVPS